MYIFLPNHNSLCFYMSMCHRWIQTSNLKFVKIFITLYILVPLDHSELCSTSLMTTNIKNNIYINRYGASDSNPRLLLYSLIPLERSVVFDLPRFTSLQALVSWNPSAWLPPCAASPKILVFSTLSFKENKNIYISYSRDHE